jgi:hypothetical protein
MEGFVVSGSNNIAEISGSLNVSGSTSSSAFNVSTFGGTTDIYHTGGGHTVITNSTANKDINYQTTGTGEHYFNSDVNVTGGNIVIGTAGNGIDFSANSNAAGMTSELLNDYEEGTWTPTVIGSGTAGTYTLSGVVAYYTKIGNQVTVFANFGFSAASGGSGYVTIGGLPFNYRTNNSALGTIMGINFDYSAGMLYAVIAATSSSSTNNIFIQEAQDNTTSTEGPIAGVTASTSFRFTYTYTVS